MKTKKIKALILEDSEDDVKLVLRELNKGQYEIEHTLVEDAAGFENALKKEWDVIIADYTLPTYTGIEALNMCNEKGIEIPFIVVSGSIGEDIAVNMMRTGVKDYIMKNNLTRLLPAIEREIAEAKIRKEKKLWEEKLIISEIQYRRLFESSKDGILILDFETGMITDVNPFLIELLGYSHDTFLGKAIWDIGFFKDIFANEENFLELKQQDYIRYEDLSLETFNGRKIDVEFISNVYQVDHKKVVQCNIRDITERKQAEENTVNSQKLLQRIIDLLPIRIFWKDTDLNYLGCNEIFAKDAGKKSSKELIGLDDFQMNWKEQANAYRNDDQKVIKSGESKINYDEQQTTPEGDKIWLKTTKMPLTDLRGNTIGILGSYEDITERKKAEEALLESEERYRVFINSTNDMAFLKDSQFKYTLINRANAKFFGKDEKEIIGKTDFDFMSESSAQKCQETDNQALASDTIIVSEEIIGEKIYETRKFRVHLSSGKFGIGGYIREITEKRLAEEALRKSEKQLSEALDIAHLGPWEYDVIKDEFTFNDNFYKIFRVTAEQVGGYKMSSSEYARRFVHPDDIEIVVKEIQETIESNDANYSKILEHRILYGDGEVGYISVKIFTVKDSSGRTIKTYGVNQDITERMQSEELLRKSEERFQLASRATNDIIYDWNLTNGVGWFSDSYNKLFGYEGTNEKFDYWKKKIHPEDFDRAISTTDKIINSGGDSWSVEYRFRRKDDSYAYVLDRGFVIRNNKGIPTRLIGSLVDFSERKESEEILRDSEEKYRTIFENIQDIFYQADNNGIITDVSPSIYKQSGWKPEELIGKPVDLFYYNKEDRINFINAITDKSELSDYDVKLKHKNGNLIYTSVNAHIRFDKNKNPIGVEGLLRNITEKKISDELLKESEERYRKLFELSPETIFIQYEGKIEFINPAGVKLFKAENENEIVGRKVIDFVHPDYKEIISQRISFINSEFVDIPLKIEKFICLDGSSIDVEVTATAFMYKGKKAALVISRDITDRKKFEEELIASEERYRVLIESMHDGIMQVDNNDKIQFVNNRICEMFGYTNEELIGKTGIDVIVIDDDREMVREKFHKHDIEYSIKHMARGRKKSGEILWLNASATPIKDEYGIVKSSVIFLSDITDRKRAEDELIKISQAINQSPVTVVITDVNGDIEYVNPKFVEVTGYSPEEVIEKNPRILKSDEKSPEEYKELWKTISSGNVWIGEFHNKKKNGELYWENASISPVKNSEGKITHYLAVKEDITEKKKREIELINAKEKAEESERLKTSFLANMSHELRTPMVGILGFAELMKDMTDDSELKEFSDCILKSGKRLMETLNLILDLSRIEAGKLEIKSSDVNIVSLTKEVFENYVAEAKKKNLLFSFITSSEKIISKVDDRMLWEAINNLINNAIKFTKKGGVTVEVKTEKIKNKKKAVISVSDTGIGIPEDSINLIFEEFRQVSEGFGRGFQGTGLGLTITKNFVEKTGGIITVESEVGVGSVFKIEFPLLETDIIEVEPEKETEVEEIPESEKKNIHLLCVDDDVFTSKYINFILNKDYILSFAVDGKSALEMAKSHTFSLILMDINLGKGMDGVETTRKIRKLPGYEKVPVIAMTAFAMKGDWEDLLNDGMDDYISKPFKTLELKKIINTVLSKSNI